MNREIRRVRTIPGSPNQNGVTKRMNKTILKGAKSMQIYVGLSKQFWAYVVNMKVYLINRRPSMLLNCGILNEAWTGKEVNINHLCTFDCIFYVHVELDRRSKLKTKSKR